MEDYRPGAATDLERDLVRDLLRERKIHRARFTTRVKDVYGPRKIANDTGREVEIDVVVGQSGERLLHLLRSYPDQEAARKDYQGTESFLDEYLTERLRHLSEGKEIRCTFRDLRLLPEEDFNENPHPFSHGI